jgi:methanogenic corrinoid protein MtbC1
LNTLAKNIKNHRKENNISQKALAEYLNVSQSSIAHYENGDRQPTLDSLIQLSNLFRISIDDLLGHQTMTESNIDYDDMKNQIMDALMKKNEVIFNQLMDRITRSEESLKKLEGLVSDLLYDIGKMWEFGDISIADEHYMSNLFRTAVNTKIGNRGPDKGIMGIALAGPNEQHTLGIELVTSLLKKEGIEVVYLGGNVPYKSLKDMVEVVNPDFILLTVTMKDHINSLIDFVDHLRDIKKNKTKIIIGGQASAYLKDYWEDDRITIVEDLNQVLSILEQGVHNGYR